MNKNHPNPGESYKKHPPVVASETDGTGVAPNMPLNKYEGLIEDLGGTTPQPNGH